jgi:hypothetical protein
VDIVTPAETDCLKALILFERECTATRFCNPIIAGVDDEHKESAKLFCKTYHCSPEYRFQAENTSQFKDRLEICTQDCNGRFYKTV